MKKKLQLGLLCLITGGWVGSVYAVNDGVYLGFQAGQSNLHAENVTISTFDINGNPTIGTLTANNGGFGARLYGGYQFNPYIGLEGGFTYYSASTYDVSSSSGAPISCGDPSVRTSAFDLVGKGILPIYTSGFGVFAKGGVAVAFLGQSGVLQPMPANSACNTNSNTNSVVVRPTYAFGASYDLNQNWVADLTFSRIMSGSGINNTDLISIGISYHFTDKFCGQFLC